MFLEQRQLTRSTQLALRPHGLYVCERTRQGRTMLEFELPYEEVLPVRVERTNATPQLQWLPLGFFWLTAALLRKTDPASAFSTQDWLLTFGFGLALIGLYRYARNNWWRHFTLRTARANVHLADRGSQRRELDEFAQALDQRAKTYLREHYSRVNPLGIIEPQLSRLRWLQELDVVTEAEARALTIRLTGRPAETLKGMGHELEAPYCN